MKEDDNLPLFETKAARGRTAYKLYAITVMIGVLMMCAYRVVHVPAAAAAAGDEGGRWAWVGSSICEVWFGFYWFLTLFNRWNPVFRHAFIQRLSQRYEEKDLPGVDIFVCTADPSKEPPILVVNSVLSVMAYNYPPEKLSVYLSDDAGSELMFYALLQASRFAKYWLPFCRKFEIEPRSPKVYFETVQEPRDHIMAKEWSSIKAQGKYLNAIHGILNVGAQNDTIPWLLDSVETDDSILSKSHCIIFNLYFNESKSVRLGFIQGLGGPILVVSFHNLVPKKLYEDMRDGVEAATKLGQISKEARKEHKGFQEWEYFPSSQHDHAAIIQILLNERDLNPFDIEGKPLPTLVYVAREKRPQYHHNFKAGALNALIRVSSKISDGSVILNVDCDVYSNNSETIRDALCYFLDKEKGHEIAYVQYPQNYNDLTKNDLYACCLRVINELEVRGMDANGGPCYIGSGCFHRRRALCGATYSKDYQGIWTRIDKRENGSCNVLEDLCKVLASCTYEEKTEWGKEVGLKYGCPSEDLVTGLAIQCRGWKSVYSYPKQNPFMGVAPKTLLQILVQHKRWSEGQFQIALSKCCPLIYGHKRIPLKLQFSYMPYLLRAANCLPMLYYVAVPTFCLIRKISLFPKISSIWILPFAYVFLAEYGYSLAEFLYCGGTIKGWWNEQRIWLFKRTSSYLFAFLDTILNQMGFTDSGFTITAKITDEDVSERYAIELMEFGASSPMFTILATLAMLNLFGFLTVLKWMVINLQILELESLALQCVLCGLLVSINWPLYQALFLRSDKGRMPVGVTCKSIALALVVSSVAVY